MWGVGPVGYVGHVGYGSVWRVGCVLGWAWANLLKIIFGYMSNWTLFLQNFPCEAVVEGSSHCQIVNVHNPIVVGIVSSRNEAEQLDPHATICDEATLSTKQLIMVSRQVNISLHASIQQEVGLCWKASIYQCA